MSLHPPSRPRYFRAAFTLIELLVVMAILAILVGLLLSGLSVAQGQAHSIQCQNNMRQIATAWVTYDGEWGLMPSYNISGAGWTVPTRDAYGHWGQWSGRIRHYLAPSRVYTCPRAPGKPDQADYGAPDSNWGAQARVMQTSYGPTVLPSQFWRTRADSLFGIRTTVVRGPSQTIMLTERMGITPAGALSTGFAVDTAPQQNPPFIDTDQGIPAAGFNSSRWRISHRGRAIIACFDGHVEAVRPYDTYIPADSGAKPNRWSAHY